MHLRRGAFEGPVIRSGSGAGRPANWCLRLPPEFAELHRERLARGAALDLRLALELALAAVSDRHR